MAEKTKPVQLRLDKADGGEVRMFAKVSDLTPDPANVNTHDERNIAAIEGSFRRFEQQKPVVIALNGQVVAGNGALVAALASGREELWVTVTGLEGVERTAFAIADNQTGKLSRFDDGNLARMLKAIQDESEETVKAIGFSDDELQKLLLKLGPPGELNDLEYRGGEGAPPGDAPGEPPTSHVRMVQLFLDAETFPEFQTMIEKLAEKYGKDNATDTCMECLRRATNDST